MYEQKEQTLLCIPYQALLVAFGFYKKNKKALLPFEGS